MNLYNESPLYAHMPNYAYPDNVLITPFMVPESEMQYYTRIPELPNDLDTLDKLNQFILNLAALHMGLIVVPRKYPEDTIIYTYYNPDQIEDRGLVVKYNGESAYAYTHESGLWYVFLGGYALFVDPSEIRLT